MKKKFTKLTAALALLALFILPLTGWGQTTWSHEFASPEAVSNNSITVDGATWSISTTVGNGSPTIDKGNSYSKYCLKFGTGASNYFSNITFSTDYFNNYNVQSVSIQVLHNASKSGTFSATQGNTTIGTSTNTIGTTWTDVTVNTTPGSGGSLSFSYAPNACAVNIHSITVVYTTGSTPQPATYTITYKAGEGSGNDVTETKTQGVDYTILGKPAGFTAPASKPNFNGWLGDDSNTYAAGDTYSTDAALTLTAQWATNGGGSTEATVTYDFSDLNNILTEYPGQNHPSSGTALTDFYYSNGDHFVANGSDNHKFTVYQGSAYFILGKLNATLQFPSFGFDVEKIEITGRTGASGSVNQNIFVGNTAVSTETTGATGTYTYVLADGYQTAGTVYTLKVTSSANTQITQIKIYKKEGGSTNPNITISGTDITNDAVSLDYDDIASHTATVAYQNITNPSPVIGVYTNSACSTAYTGSDFSASFTDNNKTTLNYKFNNANTSTTDPRVVYLRLSEGETISNVITITQAAKPVLYSVTFNLDGGTFVANTAFSSTTNSKPAGTYALPSASKTNWNFGGWKLDGTETIYQAGANYPVSADVSFTAQWVLSKTAVYTVTSTSTVSASGIIPQGSTATYSSTYTDKYQLTAGKSMTLTLTGYAGQRITGVTLNMKSNGSAGAGYLTITGGTTSIRTIGSSTSGVPFNDEQWNGSYTTSYVDVNVLTNGVYAIQTDENLVITIGCTTNSLYCKSFSITYQDEAIPMLEADDLGLTYSATSGEIPYQKYGTGSGDVTASTTASWISNVNVDGANNKVTFACTANDGAERSATITITWGELTKEVTVTQAGLPCTVTYDANGGSGTMTDANSPYTYGETVTVKDNSFTHATLTFDNWNTAADGSGTSYNPNSTFTITGDVTLYAQWRGNHSYSLVSSVTDLKAGQHYIIVGKKETESVYYAMSSQNNSNNIRNAVVVTNTGGTIEEVSGIREFVFSGDPTNKWTIYDKLNPGYLYASSKTSNIINTRDNNESADSQWSISFDNDTAFIVAQGENTRNEIRFNYNNGNPRFSCYGSSSSLKTKAYLYVRDDDKDYEFYSNTTLASATTIANDETYTVHKPAVLNIASLTCDNSANLIIEDGGQLIHNTTVKATLKKNITAYTNEGGAAGTPDGWYTIATPVDGTATEVTTVTIGDYDLFRYDEASAMWRNQQNSENSSLFTNLVQGIGYLYANDANQVLEFAGEMIGTNSNVEVPLSFASGNTDLKGVNLVGNPFTCNVNSNVKIGNAGLTSYSYVANGTEIATANLNDRPIQPAEGFLVQTSAEANLVFNPTGKDGASTKPAYVRIEAGNESFMDRAYVQIGNGNTLRKMTLNDNVAHVSVQHNGKDFAAATIEEAQGEMPVIFKAAVDGTYTISVATEGIEANYLHLIDNLTGMDVDLLSTPSYTFNARKSDYASRFRLVFSANSANENNSDSFAFVSNGQIIFTNADNNATVQVIDALGRMIVNTQVGNCIYTDGMATGVYVLRLVNGNDVKTQKIVVK